MPTLGGQSPDDTKPPALMGPETNWCGAEESVATVGTTPRLDGSHSVVEPAATDGQSPALPRTHPNLTPFTSRARMNRVARKTAHSY